MTYPHLRRTEGSPGTAFPFHPTRLHPTPRQVDRAAVPTGLWLSFLALGSAGLALLCWSVANLLPGGDWEISLRDQARGSTLGAVKALRERPPEPPYEPVVAEVRPAPPSPPVVPAPPPPMLELPPVEAPPLVVVTPRLEPPPPEPVPVPVVALVPAPEDKDHYPLVFNQEPSGDTPMLRNWKMLALYSMTVVVVTAPPVVAQTDDYKTILERLDKMDRTLAKSFEGISADISALKNEVLSAKNQITSVQKDLTLLQGDTLSQKVELDKAAKKVETLESQIAKLRTELDDLKRRPSAEPAPQPLDKASLDDLRLKLGGIEKAILGLNLTPPQERVSKSPPAAPAAVGRVMLVNLYPEELLFVINQRTFRVPAGGSLPVEAVPSGSLAYEVLSPTWGLRARRTTSLAPNETFTLTAR